MEPQENARQRKIDKTFAYIKSNMAGVILVLLCVFFIIQDCFKMTRTGASFEEVIGSIAKNIIFGISISVLLRIQGLSDGKKSDEFRGSLVNYAKAKKNISKNQDILPAYCNYKNESKLNDTRKQYLEENGFSYKKYLDGYYELDDVFEKLTQEQRVILNKVTKVSIHRITPNELMYESSEFRKKPDYFNESKERASSEVNYLSSSSIKDMISKVVLGIIFGCYALDPLINEDTLSGIIWSIFKLLVYLFFGFIAYMDAYNYTLNEYRHTHLIQKTYLLEECAVIIEKNPELLEKYSDEELVIKQLETEEEKEYGRKQEEKGE